MLRRGIDPFARAELDAPRGNLGFTRVSRGELRKNSALATLIVSNVFVGIRSSVEIPAKYRSYFHYRWNFLILTAKYALPIGLVRFLLAQWCINPYSLWLRRACTLKSYLRKVPTQLVLQAERRLRVYSSQEFRAGNGSCTPTSPSEPEFYSDSDGCSDDLD